MKGRANQAAAAGGDIVETLPTLAQRYGPTVLATAVLCLWVLDGLTKLNVLHGPVGELAAALVLLSAGANGLWQWFREHKNKPDLGSPKQRLHINRGIERARRAAEFAEARPQRWGKWPILAACFAMTAVGVWFTFVAALKWLAPAAALGG